MKMILKKSKYGLCREERGNALILVLVFFLLGSLTLMPLLAQMGTTLKAGVKYETNTNEIYAADAGIETGLWRIKDDFLGPTYSPYDFSSNWSYETGDVNGQTADVTVQNVWMPPYAIRPDRLGLTITKTKTMVDSKKLIITGTAGVNPALPFNIKIDFKPAVGDNLTVKQIGVWVPQGFSYKSSDLATLPLDNVCRSIPTTQVVSGGRLFIWNYTGPQYPLFINFPNYSTENSTQSVAFGFTYNTDNPNLTPSTAVAWVLCEMHDQYGSAVANPYDPANVPIAWDTAIRYYRITSASGDTNIEAYSTKTQDTNLGNGIAGDYEAIGNSLLKDKNGDGRREYANDPSSYTETKIPVNADVLYAYLYWSASQQGTEQSFYQDDCSTFTDKWDRTVTNTSHTIYPSADGSSYGTWSVVPSSPSNAYSKVNETTPNGDTNYIKCTGLQSNKAYRLFSFASPTIPAGDIISKVTIYVTAEKESGTGSPALYAGLIIRNGSQTPYLSSNSTALSTSWATYSFSWTQNPKTGSAWTVTDITSSGSTNGLQQFGVYCTGVPPNVWVTSVNMVVEYQDFTWFISSGKFQAQGSTSFTTAQRTLTMQNFVNITSGIPECVVVTWDQTKSGLAATDALYFAFSGDNGATWSNNIMSGNGTLMSTPYYYVIPIKYFSSTFKIRFYAYLNSSGALVTVDNIKVTFLPPDTSVSFKINDTQYSFSANGTPQTGGEITSTRSQAFPNLFGSSFVGYSYACKRDVTDIVKNYPVIPGEQHHNGNYTYTVGGVAVYADHDLSYAGWSLIIIYSCPSSAGHFLYIQDAFGFNPANLTGGVDLDFDQDGIPGGDVVGFKVPKIIYKSDSSPKYPIAARLTCFIGEGDSGRLGDSIAVKGKTSSIVELATNAFDGKSTYYTETTQVDDLNIADGIDIDTFAIYWSQNILKSGDTTLHVDLWGNKPATNPSTPDAYNLIYFILSVQSETTSRTTGHYVIQ